MNKTDAIDSDAWFEQVIESLDLDDAAIATRKAYLQLTPDDCANLNLLHRGLAGTERFLADSFYQHLQNFSETARFVTNEKTLKRLKQSQSAYFNSLTAGVYDRDYIHDRLKVGLAHERIGLEPTWYLGAYARYLSDLIPMVIARFDHEVERQVAIVQSLLKIVILDMSLAIDAYMASKQLTIEGLNSYAELAFANMPFSLVVLSPELEILGGNPAAQNFFDLHDGQLNGHRIQQLALADDLWEAARLALRDGETQKDLETVMTLMPAGEQRPVRIQLVPFSRPGAGRRLLLAIEDLKEIHQLEDTLNENLIMLNRSQSVARLGSWQLNFVTGELLWSDETYRMFGVPRGRPLDYEGFMALVHEDDRDHVDQAWQAAMRGQPYSIDHRIVIGNDTFWVHELAEIEFDADGAPLRAIGTVQDITERKLAEARIQQLAYFDILTGIPNRTLCLDRLRQKLREAQRHGRSLAVLFIDLDRFKQVNDSLGHAQGDNLLKEIATRMQQCVRSDDTVARLGGDEFTVILDEVNDEGAAHVARKILATTRRPIDLDGHQYHASCSIGIALFPRDGRDADTLLRNADMAMYQAKRELEGLCFFDHDMDRRAHERMIIESELYQAIDRQELLLHFQPRADLCHGGITGMESLVRWQHPERGLVPPDEFIPVAEETGLIIPLGRWVLRQACEQFMAWRKQGLEPGRMAVNLSPRQFRDPRLVSDIESTLEATGIEPRQLEIEITESMLAHGMEQALDVLNRLHGMGIRLAIDDFGTGYSSLNQLKQLPVDELKIDKSFVNGLPSDKDDIPIVLATLSMAHALGLEVVAEGVETDEQLDFLKANGCEEIQGYLFSRPLEAGAMERLLAEGASLDLAKSVGRPAKDA